mgnify:CR=1 FL=1
MAMMYGDIDKSREKRNDLNLIITNLTKVLGFLQASEDIYERNTVEKLVEDSLKSALKLKGDG